jgi:predicted nucleic acid-binding protein
VEKLVLDQRVSGIHVHDARIAAAMVVHGVTNILTFDLDDFSRYPQILVLHPKDAE